MNNSDSNIEQLIPKPKPPEAQPLNITLDQSDLQKKVKPYPLGLIQLLQMFINKLKGENYMWQSIKNFLVAKILQWILKFAGGFLVSLGISSDTIEEIIAGIISLIAGIIYSLITHKKVAFTNPEKFFEK